MGGGAIDLTTLLDSVGWEETFFTKFLRKNYQPAEFAVQNCQKALKTTMRVSIEKCW